jgi:4-carboxymuconolactone decarboxylase
MAKSELYLKGEAMRRKLRSDADYEKNMQEYAADPHTQKFIDLATETVFGALWSRPGLDLKTRTLVCVITDATMGRHAELDIHLRFALRQGWTEDELVEVLLHMSGYIGVPLIREAIFVAKDVFADERKKKAAQNP